MRKLLLLLATTAALAAPVAAKASATTERVPFDADVIACNGDVIHISGTLLSVFTETATPSGGFVVSSHFQPQGIKGVDLTSGTKYVATGLTRDIVVVSPAGGTTETFVNRFHIQATGGAESFIVSETFHITVTPNGDVTAFLDNFSSTC
jgi:hypothetical protein